MDVDTYFYFTQYLYTFNVLALEVGEKQVFSCPSLALTFHFLDAYRFISGFITNLKS